MLVESMGLKCFITLEVGRVQLSVFRCSSPSVLPRFASFERRTIEENANIIIASIVFLWGVGVGVGMSGRGDAKVT